MSFYKQRKGGAAGESSGRAQWRQHFVPNRSQRQDLSSRSKRRTEDEEMEKEPGAKAKGALFTEGSPGASADPGGSSSQSKSGISILSKPSPYVNNEPAHTEMSSRYKHGLSCLSLKSHQSMNPPIIFSNDPGPLDSRSGLSCLSLKSAQSKNPPIIFSNEPAPLDSQSELSYLSMKSKNPPLIFGNDPTPSDLKLHPGPEGPSGQQTQLDTIFMHLETNIVSFVINELKRFHRILSPDYPEFQVNEEDEEQRSREAFLKITLDFLRRMNEEGLADQLESKSYFQVQHKLKSSLQRRYQCVFEGIAKEGNPTSLNQIFTELFITEGGLGGVNDEHEVRQIETISRKSASPENTITCKDIFKGFEERQGSIRTVLTKGVAGIGKTVLTQKFSLDWAEGRTNPEIQLLFPLTFRELNLLRDKQFSLVGLVHHFFSECAGLCSFEDLEVVFIFDGLDEWRLPLDFTGTKTLTDATESTSVDVLLVNLIRGTLLPTAHLWITTRPAAANQIPAQCVTMVTEVRGFTDLQKDQYFRKRFEDKEQATAVLSHIKRSRSLHIMCHIPVFCWITATVLQHVLGTEARDQLPQTLTEMYIHFIVVQTKVKCVKYDGLPDTDQHWSPETIKMVESLGKLAFEQLQKRNIIFYDSDLIECGLDPTAAAVYSGVFTQVFREETGLYQDKVYCFVHLSVQEFLAALHVHLTFFNSGVNLLTMEQQPGRSRAIMKRLSLWSGSAEFYQSAVDKTLQSPNGNLDLFLRFLMGLSLSTNQKLLRGLLTQTGSNAKANLKTVKYIQEKINEDLSSERILNLFHCLNELNNRTLVKEIQQYLRSGHILEEGLSPGLWSALAFLILSSNKDLSRFDLKEYCASETALLRLVPVVKASNRALLRGCNLSERSCGVLSSILSSQFSSLSHLDLSNNDLQDSGVELLCSGLESSFCRLETLSLWFCNLTERSCSLLSTVFSSQSGLRQLDLSNNDLQDSGVELLCSGLKSPLCRLEALRLSGCLISEEGGASLTSTLSSTQSKLRELDLRYNHLGPSALRHLTSLWKDRHSSHVTLRVEPAGVQWMTPGLRKYSCELTLDPNTTDGGLLLSEDKKSVRHQHLQFLPFVGRQFRTYHQTLSSIGLTGRCYWEVVWSGEGLNIAVSYKGLGRRGGSEFGQNDQSWSLKITNGDYFVCHNKIQTPVSSSAAGSHIKSVTARQSQRSGRVGMYLDSEAGSLSFYEASTGKLLHLHTFNATFTEPLFVGFGLWSASSVSLVDLRIPVGIIAPPSGCTLIQSFTVLPTPHL